MQKLLKQGYVNPRLKISLQIVFQLVSISHMAMDHFPNYHRHHEVVSISHMAMDHLPFDVDAFFPLFSVFLFCLPSLFSVFVLFAFAVQWFSFVCLRCSVFLFSLSSLFSVFVFFAFAVECFSFVCLRCSVFYVAWIVNSVFFDVYFLCL